MNAWRRRLEQRELDRLREAFPEAVLLPAPSEWPLRLLVAACLTPQGRRWLAHRFRAWRALPGESWYDFRRMVVGVVQGGPPGAMTLRCATRETLHFHPDALEDPDAIVSVDAPWRTPVVLRDVIANAPAAAYGAHSYAGRPVVWLERDVDLAAWYRV